MADPNIQNLRRQISGQPKAPGGVERTRELGLLLNQLRELDRREAEELAALEEPTIREISEPAAGPFIVGMGCGSWLLLTIVLVVLAGAGVISDNFAGGNPLAFLPVTFLFAVGIFLLAQDAVRTYNSRRRQDLGRFEVAQTGIRARYRAEKARLHYEARRSS